MHKLAAGVLGASGYAGRELCALIERHPQLELRFATANDQKGTSAQFGERMVTFQGSDEVDLGSADIVFCALPHGASAKWVSSAADKGAKVVDLSSDLRPGNTPEPAVYGLTEFQRKAVGAAGVVANPGCYPTAILFALAPLATAGLLRTDAVVNVSAASGVTGAGFSPKLDLLFGEVTENFKAYSVGNRHRHLPEMRSTLAGWGFTGDLIFTPHLLPVARGILATITVELSDDLEDPNAVFQKFYKGERFAQVTSAPPMLRDVAFRNSVKMHAVRTENVSRPTLTIFSAIDNLVKGAAGQALQNGNLMLGLPEEMGLTA
jgi:N-acetyl-gamma-glutamyl-phosphate reductase